MRELEASFTERITESAVAVFEKLSKSDAEDDRMIFFKKVIMQSHI